MIVKSAIADLHEKKKVKEVLDIDRMRIVDIADFGSATAAFQLIHPVRNSFYLFFFHQVYQFLNNSILK